MSRKYKLLLLALIIVAIGIATIYSSVCDKESSLERSIYKRQIMWVVIGLAFFWFFSELPYRKLWDLAYVLYAGAIFLLLLVLVLGAIRMGAQRWLKLVWLNFQPSELTKLATIICLARYFSSKPLYSVGWAARSLGIVRGLGIPLFLVGVPVLLILKQPDLGTGLLVFFIFLAIIFVAQVKLRYLISMAVCMGVSLPFFWHFLRDYQRDRLLVFLNPNIDPLGAGYTVIQSKIAVGSGGLFGKGWLSGTQSQLRFLPESHTDFIFSTFAEAWGFFGVAVLIALYAVTIKICLDIAERQHDAFGRLLAFGITAMLAVQIVINIAMTVGLAPVVGIPLPLMSYGGSSLLMMFISLGILSNIDKNRSVF